MRYQTEVPCSNSCICSLSTSTSCVKAAFFNHLFVFYKNLGMEYPEMEIEWFVYLETLYPLTQKTQNQPKRLILIYNFPFFTSERTVALL